jgi:hypothetical protein
MLFSKHTLFFKSLSNVLQPVFGWLENGWTSGLSNLSEEITINGQTKTPIFSYRGADAGASTWTGTYGSTLSIDAAKGSVDPVLDNLGPFLDDTLDVALQPSGKIYSAASGNDFSTDDIVIELVFMIKDLASSVEHTIVSKYSGSNPRWALIVSSAGSPTFYANTSVSSMNVAMGSAVIAAGAWYHMLIVIDRSGSGISYLNGSLASTATSVSARNGETLDNSHDFMIGSYENAAAARVFDGHIALVRCWTGASWLDTHLQPNLAMERFAKLSGVQAQYAGGQAYPTTMTRTTTDNVFIQRGGEIIGYKVGARWIPVNKLTSTDMGMQRCQQVTNPLLHMKALDNAAWTKLACTVSVGAELGPIPADDATGNLRTIDADGTTAEHGISQVGAVTISGGNPNFITLSAVAKAGNEDWIYLEVPTMANLWAYVNVATGAIGTLGSATHTARARLVRGGAYRVELSGLGIVGSTTYTVRVLAANADGGKTYAGAAGDLHVGWVQLEAGQWCASSYIHTTTAAATRTADSLTYSATDNVPQGASSTVVASFTLPYVPAVTNSMGGTLGSCSVGSSSAEQISVGLQSTRQWVVSGISGNVTQWQFATGAIAVVGKNTYRMLSALNDIKAHINGAAAYATDVAATLPTGMTTIQPASTRVHNGQLLIPLNSFRIYDQIVAPGEQGTGADT